MQTLALPSAKRIDRRVIMSALALCSLATAATWSKKGFAMTPTMPLVRLAELEIDPKQLDAYLILLIEEIETSVSIEPGVLALNAVALKDAPGHIRLMEVYASQEAYEAHLKSTHFLKYKSSTSTMVKSLNLLETTPIALRSKPD